MARFTVDPKLYAEPDGYVRGVVFMGSRTAAEKLWPGDGIRALIARLPAETRVALLEEAIFSNTPVAERYLLDWYRAVFDHVAQNEPAYETYILRRTEAGFGAVSRVMLRLLVSIDEGAKRLPGIWSSDHSRGELSGEVIGPNHCRLTLRDHLYLSDRVGRLTVGQIFRAAVQLWRQKPVALTVGLANEERMEVDLRWP